METQTISGLQQQYPLSPKKWTKKLIQIVILCIWQEIFFGIITLMIWFEFGKFFPLGVALLIETAVILVNGLIRRWYGKEYIKRYYYATNENFLTIRKGVFTPTEIHVQFSKIQDVYVDQDLMDRFLGIFDVHIASATVASGIVAHIDGVDEMCAEGLKNLLLDKVSGSNQSGASPSTPAPDTQKNPELRPLGPDQMISSEQYPIRSSWLFVSFLGPSTFAGITAFIYAAQAVNMNAKDIDTNIMHYVTPWLSLYLIITVPLLIVNAVWKKNFRFAFFQDYILYSTKVLTRSETHMPYRTIQDVAIFQSFTERLFGIAHVQIQNAASTQQAQQTSALVIPGQSYEDAQKIAEIIRSITQNRNATNTGL